MLIDTHCHLDAADFDSDRAAVVERAQCKGVAAIVIPAVARSNFDAVGDLARSFQGGCYALGIHPIAVPDAREEDLEVLEACIAAAMGDDRFVGVGEIGLDFFIPSLKQPDMREKQERYFDAQLKIARRFGLPVVVHVRRSQDDVLKFLRRHPDVSGIAHAFNGSRQQAQHFISQGFVLGFGGAMTFNRALQIRRLASDLPADALVLETDAPDIPPAWLGAAGARPARNEPAELARIAQELAALRGVPVDEVLEFTARNALRALPRLSAATIGASA